MRISDWSSDVCSSDLQADHGADTLGDGGDALLVDLLGRDDGHTLPQGPVEHVILHRRADTDLDHPACIDQALADGVVEAGPMAVSQAEAVWPGIHMGVEMHEEIGRAACRERVCQYV